MNNDIVELQSQWLASGSVDDGHAYVRQLHRHGILPKLTRDQVFSELLAKLPVQSVERADSYHIVDADVAGFGVRAVQQHIDPHWYFNLVQLKLDGVPYVFLPQRWAQTPVRMTRIRATAWPDPFQIGQDAYDHWLDQVRRAYDIHEDSAVSGVAPIASDAIELDLSVIGLRHWRTLDSADHVKRLAGLIDMLLCVNGVGSTAIDPPLVATEADDFPDQAKSHVDLRGGWHGMTAKRLDTGWELKAWSWKEDSVESESQSKATLSKVKLELKGDTWSYEKNVVWESS